MDTQTQIDRLIELAIIQRTELKQLVEQLPQLREHLNAEVERTFEEAEPQIRTELEEFVTRQAADKTATLGTALEAKIEELAKSLEESAQAKYSALIATRDQNATLLAQAEERIAAASAELPAKVKDIVAAELARFPRAGEIDQLRKEFAEPRGLNPRGKWQAGETYNKLDLVTINGDSYTSNTDNNITRPTRSSSDWTLVAARGAGGGGGPTSLSELTTVPSNGDLLIGSGTSWVTSNLTAGAGISITVGAGEITISATDGDITLDDGTAASPSLHFTNDADTGIYRPADNTLGISVSGTQIAYFDANGLTIPSAGVVAGGSFHGANGNANNPTFSFSSDQDTGMYRHGTNELGFTVGGTQKAVLTSTTFTVTPNLVGSGSGTFGGNLTVSGSGTIDVTNAASRALIIGPVAQSGGNLPYASIKTLSTFADFALNLENTNATAGQGLGLRIVAGSASNDLPLFIRDRTNATTLFSVSGTGNTTLAGNLTVSGGTVTSGTGTLTLNSSANTVVLQSAGTTALTLDSSQNATFDGTVTLVKSQDARTLLTVNNSNSGSSAQSALRLITASNTWYVQAERNNDQFAIIQSSSDALRFDSSRNATFSGTIATQGGTASTPASASATGTAGTIKWDASYIYVCTAANTWKRVAIATW
jgi:hypothetical protein